MPVVWDSRLRNREKGLPTVLITPASTADLSQKCSNGEKAWHVVQRCFTKKLGAEKQDSKDKQNYVPDLVVMGTLQ